MSRLANKTALVTGSSSGVGRAIALAYADQGARLIVCADLQPHGRSEILDEAARATHEIIEERRGARTSFFVQTDATIPADVTACVAKAISEGGCLDILVNCVGGGIMGPRLHEMTAEDWDASMTLNLRSTFLFCKAAISQFLKQPIEAPHVEGSHGQSTAKRQRGVIINISSIFGLVGHSGGAAYDSTKAAIVNLSRHIAVDYARDRIRCNAVCPAHIVTALTKQWFDIPEIADYMRGSMPMWSETGKEDVANAAVFLASEIEAGWITGVALPVDGGYTAR